MERLDRDGYALLPQVFTAAQCDAALAELNQAFAEDAGGAALRSGSGGVYGARNLLQTWPGAARAWWQPPLPELLRAKLGPAFGLVRVLFFDKPPGQSWALPWHKDMTIAVRDNRLPSRQFTKPTRKAGVPHVEAPQWLLDNMLTLRWHLDDMTDDNGPLKVLPGSHASGKAMAAGGAPVSILGRRGDALLMRPLLSHCSNRSAEATEQHRRILHFEFAGIETLADGYDWHDFIRGID